MIPYASPARYSRRTLFGLLGGAAAGLALTPAACASLPDLAGLRNLAAGAAPIGVAERRARIEKAQALMARNNIGAILIEPGSSLIYFTGLYWWRSERLTACILPREGEPCIVTPFFERPSVEETLAVPAEIRVWQEDEDPAELVAGFLKDRKLDTRPVGIEATTRYFAVEGLQRALPDAELVSADLIVRRCRMIKSPAEIALMQVANDVTLAAYRWVYPRIETGMSQADVSAMMDAATRKLGGEPEFSMVLVGKGSAYPHGTNVPETVAPGQVVLMDCGCNVQGYQSDISRTFVHGAASAEQRKVWDHVAEGQKIAFRTAQIGVSAGKIDDAVRAYYESLGYGPRYALPGLSHRTGHGIGLDGHEPVNLVHGETALLSEGMCFSNEPGLYLPGQFGVRLEDCIHMTTAGPKYFSTPPESLDAPMG
ncbi:MAG TPA: Xaa-Pro peptidase family protein [Hyphomonas sp.]|nr:Xaa-Pro peptidase family protein [Hyphomonas sp.]